MALSKWELKLTSLADLFLSEDSLGRFPIVTFFSIILKLHSSLETFEIRKKFKNIFV